MNFKFKESCIDGSLFFMEGFMLKYLIVLMLLPISILSQTVVGFPVSMHETVRVGVSIYNDRITCVRYAMPISGTILSFKSRVYIGASTTWEDGQMSFAIYSHAVSGSWPDTCFGISEVGYGVDIGSWIDDSLDADGTINITAGDTCWICVYLYDATSAGTLAHILQMVMLLNKGLSGLVVLFLLLGMIGRDLALQ